VGCSRIAFDTRRMAACVDFFGRSYTIREKPRQTGKNQWGPSGASVWGAPTIDAKRGLLYVSMRTDGTI
jgi:hypothetical protein